jgi:hypothetical protein
MRSCKQRRLASRPTVEQDSRAGLRRWPTLIRFLADVRFYGVFGALEITALLAAVASLAIKFRIAAHDGACLMAL